MLMPSAAAMKVAKQRPGDKGKGEKGGKGGKVDPRDVPDPSEVAATAQSAKMRSLVVDLLPPLTPFAADAFDHHQGVKQDVKEDVKQDVKQGVSSGVVKTEIKAESNTESKDGSTALGEAAAALWERSLITLPFDEYGADAGQTRLAVKPLPSSVREAALGLNPTQVREREREKEKERERERKYIILQTINMAQCSESCRTNHVGRSYTLRNEYFSHRTC